MEKFNGHSSWDMWNVSLWLNNDEELYNLQVAALKRSTNFFQAATRLRTALQRSFGLRTPDGAQITLKALRSVLRDTEAGENKLGFNVHQ